MLTKLRGRAALAAGLATLLLQAGPVAAQTPEAASTGSTQVTAMASAPAVTVAELFPTPAAATPKSEAGLPLDVLEAAAAYRLYMGRAAAQPTTFTDTSVIANSLREAAAYEPKQLARGAIAFAAVAALQDETFKQSVRAFAADPARRKQLTALLVASPSYSSALLGADTAAQRAVAALAGEGARVRTVGERVKQAAYDVQRQDWSKVEVSDRVARLEAVKSLSAVPLTGLDSDIALLRQAATVTPSTPALFAEAASVQPVANTTPTGAQPWPTLDGKELPTQVVSRALTIAALAVLGEANSAVIDPMLDDANCGSCLRMSKLNLFQCLAVAKPWYEDVFCLGQHVLMDTGDCIQAAAMAKGPAAAPPRAAPTATPVAPTPAVTLVSTANSPPPTPTKPEPAASPTSVAALH